MAQTQLDRVYVQAIDGAGDGINSLSIGTKSLTTRVNIGGLGTDSNSIQINGAGTTITGPVAMGIVTAANTTITNASITNLGVTANASMTNVSIHTLSVVGQTTLANVGVAGQTTLQNTSVNGTLRVDGQSTLINVSATSLTSSSLTILNNVSMGGNVSIGSLFVSSNLVLPSGSNTVLANASINGTLRADGVTTLKEVTLQNASINLNTRMDGSLTVLGATEFYNTVAARGASNTFTVEGQTTLSNTSIQGLTVTGTVNVSTNITGILQNTYNLGIGRGIITNNVIDNFAGGDLSLRNKPLNSLHVADVSNTIIRIGPMGYQGTAANTTEYGLERSRHSIVFSGFRDQQQDLIGTKISSINKQTYGGGTQQLIQSSDLAFFTMAPGLVPMITDITTERMRIMDGGNVGIGTSAPGYTLDVSGTMNVTGAVTANLATSCTAVTQAQSNNSTKIATTAYVDTGLGLKANIASPTFTGTVTIPAGAVTGTLGVTGLTTLSGGATVTGNVGIGTTTPGHTLDVSGSIRVTGTTGKMLMQVQDTPTNTENTEGIATGTNKNILYKFIPRTNAVAIAAPVNGVYILSSGTTTFYANYEAGYLLSGQSYKITLRAQAQTSGTGISFDNNMGDINVYKLDLGTISTTEYKTYYRVVTVPVNNVFYVSIYGTGNAVRTINFAHFSIEPFYTTTVGSLSATGDSKIGVWHMSNQISRYQLGTSNVVGEHALEHSPGGTVLNAYLNQYSNANIEFQISNSTKMLMNKSGYLGIGTISPDFPLHVYNYNSYTKSNYATLAAYWINGYGNGGDGLTITQKTATANDDTERIASVGIAICSEAGILIKKNSLLITSDRRIKANIVDVDDDRALVDLRRLKPKTYTYKDTIGRSSETVYGFIAQEVKEVLDYSSRLITDAIPNLYELATFSTDNLTLDFNTSELSRDASGALFTKLKVKTREGKDEYVNILEILDEHTLKVDKDLTEWGGMLDASGELVEGNQIFVYGQEVNDFHILNKEAIWTVATAALQEVDRQLQSEKQKTATLETTLASTQATLASCQETLAALVARIDALEQR